MSRIGVLAVQGAFREHIDALSGLGARCFEIRKASDLETGPMGWSSREGRAPSWGS